MKRIGYRRVVLKIAGLEKEEIVAAGVVREAQLTAQGKIGPFIGQLYICLRGCNPDLLRAPVLIPAGGAGWQHIHPVVILGIIITIAAAVKPKPVGIYRQLFPA